MYSYAESLSLFTDILQYCRYAGDVKKWLVRILKQPEIMAEIIILII